jgi:hypothetical protein
MGWFGPNRDDVWRELSQELKGEFIEARFWRGRECKVRARVGCWTATLETGFSDEEDAGVTRLRAPFLNPEGFRFSVHRKVFLSRLGKQLGTLQDLDLGDPEFGEAFVVQGSDEEKVRALLSDLAFRRKLLAEPKLRLFVSPIGSWFGPKPEPGVEALQLQLAGKVGDLDRLRQMFRIFAAALDRLCAIGVTRMEMPAAAE